MIDTIRKEQFLVRGIKHSFTVCQDKFVRATSDFIYSKLEHSSTKHKIINHLKVSFAEFQPAINYLILQIITLFRSLQLKYLQSYVV